jgi:hypothetical protein
LTVQRAQNADINRTLKVDGQAEIGVHIAANQYIYKRLFRLFAPASINTAE